MLKFVFSELSLLGKPVLQNVRDLMQAGCPNIELMADGDGWDDLGGLWNRLAAELPKTGASFSLHPPAWDINLTSPIRELRDAAYVLHEKSIEFAHKIGASHLVLHPGFCNSSAFDKSRARSLAREAAERLAVKAKSLSLRLAFENVGYHGSSIYTDEEFCHALDGLDETLGYLIDTGHAHLNHWDVPALIDRLKDRIVGIHLHDNKADADRHLPMYEGSLNWPAIFRSIQNIPGDCNLVLEYAPGTPPDKLSEGCRILRKALLP
ncbi:MAG: sugar phosphate isomerase/epimerase [Spirochaetaceae bacterium]|jgi:sugar phosphate isomerase/epimerase|nr:sugar phosphate isomerase/epimerase [Spirochaetaceae bacterium]